MEHKATSDSRPDLSPKTWQFLMTFSTSLPPDSSITPDKLAPGLDVGFQEKLGLVVGQDVQPYDASIVTTGKTNSFSVTQLMGSFSSSGAGNGIRFNANDRWAMDLSRDNTGNSTIFYFINPNGVVGSVRTSGNSTAYNTSSDERLKHFTGKYDPLEAVAVIRADPVRTWTWLSDGSVAVGWGAQSSYEVSPDLASPGQGEPGEDGFVPWGVDQAKRTPYLWAALSHVLDKIDALEARVAALENGAGV